MKLAKLDVLMKFVGFPEGWDTEEMKERYNEIKDLEANVGIADLECYIRATDTDVVMTTVETDAEFMARLRIDEKLTYEDISSQINKRKASQRRHNIRERCVPEDIWVKFKTINDLRHHLTEASGRENVFRANGKEEIPTS